MNLPIVAGSGVRAPFDFWKHPLGPHYCCAWRLETNDERSPRRCARCGCLVSDGGAHGWEARVPKCGQASLSNISVNVLVEPRRALFHSRASRLGIQGSCRRNGGSRQPHLFCENWPADYRNLRPAPTRLIGSKRRLASRPQKVANPPNTSSIACSPRWSI
jgi:hypothetical protein